MIFTSLTFLFFFIVLMACLWVSDKDTYRIYVLLIGSYVFYGVWKIEYLILIAYVSVVTWYLGLKISEANTKYKKKKYLVLNLVSTLFVLGYFKYANFFIDNLNSVLPGDIISTMDIILPVGISFFTFQAISYSIDVYRGHIIVCRDLVRFLLYVSFFPQLVAGPIVRATDFIPQLHGKINISCNNFFTGVQIFLVGVIQKAIFADNLSIFVDKVFSEPSLYSGATLWLALFSYSLQIFCDFSGYSLMAIGIAKILGFSLPDNFNMPYISSSITEFWRRWHISLSSWLRDYLYIPLGGSRDGVFRTYLNLFVTMVLGGLWHGASWNFILWGAGHGLLLGVHKVWVNMTAETRLATYKEASIYKAVCIVLLLTIVTLLWVPFRSGSFSTTIEFYMRIFSMADGVEWMHLQSTLLLLIACFWHVLHLHGRNVFVIFDMNQLKNSRGLFVVFSWVLIIAMFAPLNASPFIYFQF